MAKILNTLQPGRPFNQGGLPAMQPRRRPLHQGAMASTTSICEHPATMMNPVVLPCATMPALRMSGTTAADPGVIADFFVFRHRDASRTQAQ